jgi:hypothetical protein
VAAEAGYRFSRGALIARHRLAPFLGIELSRNRSGADQVAEEYRQTPPLAGRSARAKVSLRMKRRARTECCCALRAESGFGWIIETAFLASALERRRALGAELRTLWGFG